MRAIVAPLTVATVDAARQEIEHLVDVLERGTWVHHSRPSGAWFPYGDALTQRIRVLRESLIELDLYRLIYGPLEESPAEPPTLPATYHLRDA